MVRVKVHLAYLLVQLTKLKCFQLQVLIPAIVLIGVGGADRLKIVASDMNDHINDFGQDAIFIWLLNFTYSDPKGIFLGTVLFCGIHALCCVLMIIGAIKVNENLKCEVK